jgi:ABC-type transport system involved in cytochrome c biogenesis permease component
LLLYWAITTLIVPEAPLLLLLLLLPLPLPQAATATRAAAAHTATPPYRIDLMKTSSVSVLGRPCL